MVNLNPKHSDINYMSRFFLLMCNPQTCPAFSRPRNFGRILLKVCPSFSRPCNICLSFSSLSFSRTIVFFVRHFQVVHFQRPHQTLYLTSSAATCTTLSRTTFPLLVLITNRSRFCCEIWWLGYIWTCKCSSSALRKITHAPCRTCKLLIVVF